MANPYQASVIDGSGVIRVEGEIVFTDPDNQPGGAPTSPFIAPDGGNAVVLESFALDQLIYGGDDQSGVRIQSVDGQTSLTVEDNQPAGVLGGLSATSPDGLKTLLVDDGGVALAGATTVAGPSTGPALVATGGVNQNALEAIHANGHVLLTVGALVNGLLVHSPDDAEKILVTNSGVGFTGGLGFFGTSATTKPTVAGALSTVADAPAKAVLTSILAALNSLGLAVNGTT